MHFSDMAPPAFNSLTLFSRSRSYRKCRQSQLGARGLSGSVFHHQRTQISAFLTARRGVSQTEFCCLVTHTPARRLRVDQFIKTDAFARIPVGLRGVAGCLRAVSPLPLYGFLTISETLQLHWIPYRLCMPQHALVCGAGS